VFRECLWRSLKRFAITGINAYEIVDGKVATGWAQTDSLGMLQQLGVLPGT
jgi:hypothetical protein